MRPGVATARVAAALTVLVALLAAGCAGVGLEPFDDPEVELLGLEPLPAQGMEARFLLRLRVVNPNSAALEIDGMAYDVTLRNTKVLTGASNEPFRVDGYSEGIAEVEVAAGFLNSLALLRDLMTNPPDGGIPYTLNAKLSRKGVIGAIRVRREGRIDLGNRALQT